MTIVFDKDLATERRIYVDNLQEQIMENRITATYEREMNEGFVPQDLSNFDNRSFSTITILDNTGKERPLQKDYNYIDMVQASYMDVINVYSIIVSILKQEK